MAILILFSFTAFYITTTRNLFIYKRAGSNDRKSIDQNYFKHESSESSNTSSEDKKLSVGSILILKEYTYENVDVIDKKANELDESEDYYLEDLIKIVDFFIIGFD